jgi:hypothetical protein
MEHMAVLHERGSGTATPPEEPPGVFGCYCPDAAGSGSNGKIDLASLLPGGQTHSAGSEMFGSGYTSSPEPVIGYGATKGIDAYYLAVLRFGSPIDTY